VDEAEYALAALYKMRGEVSANRESFDPDAQERIEEANRSHPGSASVCTVAIDAERGAKDQSCMTPNADLLPFLNCRNQP